MIFNVITAGSGQYGGTYRDIFFLAVIFIPLAWIFKGVLLNYIIFGNKKQGVKLLVSAGIGLIIGLPVIFNFSIFSVFNVPLINLNQTFSITSQNQASITPATTLNSIGIDFVEVFLVPIIETIFFLAILFPTFATFLRSPGQLPMIFIFAGAIYITLFNGLPSQYVIGGLFIIIGLLLLISKKLKANLSYKSLDRIIIAAAIMSFIAAAYHYKSYNGTGLQNAFYFFFVSALLVYWQQDIMGALALHALVNGASVSSIYSIPWIITGTIIGLIIFVMLAIYKYGSRIFPKSFLQMTGVLSG